MLCLASFAACSYISIHADMQSFSHTYKAGNAHHLVAALNLCNMLN